MSNSFREISTPTYTFALDEEHDVRQEVSETGFLLDLAEDAAVLEVVVSQRKSVHPHLAHHHLYLFVGSLPLSLRIRLLFRGRHSGLHGLNESVSLLHDWLLALELHSESGGR